MTLVEIINFLQSRNIRQFSNHKLKELQAMADQWNTFVPMFGDYIPAKDVIMERLTYVNHQLRDSRFYIGKKEVVIQVLRGDGMPYLISHSSSTIIQWITQAVDELKQRRGYTMVFRFTYDATAQAKWGVDYMFVEGEPELPPVEPKRRKSKNVPQPVNGDSDIPF